MSQPPQQNDNNLLSFLKNQSLFNGGSPTRRMSSRSRDRKSDRNRSPGANQQYQGNTTYTTTYNNGAPVSLNENNRVVSTSYQTSGYQGTPQTNININGTAQNYQVGSNIQGGTTIQGGANYQGQATIGGGNYTSTTTTYGTGGNYTQVQGTTVVSTANEKTYASSFESARLETAKRL